MFPSAEFLKALFRVLGTLEGTVKGHVYILSRVFLTERQGAA